ncbi:MAG TPA: prenyltransferase [Ardenticatenaceae bacterium]|nr:prenyltransferase [Ardenticatenaceae bacterium]
MRTSRPLLWLNTAIPAALATVTLDRPIDLDTVLLAIYFTLPFNLFLHGINDVFDYESDLVNARKGGAEGNLLARRLHAPMLRRMLALNVPFVLVLLITGTPLGNVLLLLLLLLGWAYSAPPFRAKGRPFLDNAVNMAYVLPFLIGLARQGAPPPEWPWYGIVAFMVWNLASHAFTSIQDVEADRRAGIATLATLLGRTRTGYYALTLYAVAGLLVARYGWVWGLCTGVYVLLVLGYLQEQSRTRANQLYRLFIAVNSLFGFVVTMTLAFTHPTATVWSASLALGVVALVIAALRYSARRPIPPSSLSLVSGLGTDRGRCEAARAPSRTPPFSPFPAPPQAGPGEGGRGDGAVPRQGRKQPLEYSAVEGRLSTPKPGLGEGRGGGARSAEEVGGG